MEKFHGHCQQQPDISHAWIACLGSRHFSLFICRTFDIDRPWALLSYGRISWMYRQAGNTLDKFRKARIRQKCLCCSREFITLLGGAPAWPVMAHATGRASRGAWSEMVAPASVLCSCPCSTACAMAHLGGNDHLPRLFW